MMTVKSDSKALLRAILAQDIGAVRACLADHPETWSDLAELSDKSRRSPLWLALAFGKVQAANLLAQNGAVFSANENLEMLAYGAGASGSVDSVLFLLDGHVAGAALGLDAGVSLDLDANIMAFRRSALGGATLEAQSETVLEIVQRFGWAVAPEIRHWAFSMALKLTPEARAALGADPNEALPDSKPYQADAQRLWQIARSWRSVRDALNKTIESAKA